MNVATDILTPVLLARSISATKWAIPLIDSGPGCTKVRYSLSQVSVRVRSGQQEVHYVGRPRKRWETSSHEDGTSLLPILISAYLLFIVRYEQRKYTFLCSKGFQALFILPSNSNMSMNMSMEQWWNDADRGKLSHCRFLCFWRDSLQCARASSLTRFLDHTQRRTTVGRTPLDE